jgi:hypothetical protein
MYNNILPLFLCKITQSYFLQLGVSFGLLNNLPPFFTSDADNVVSEQFSFLRCEVVTLTPNPHMEDQGNLLRPASTP